MPEGVRVLDAAARRFGIQLHFDHFDWSCDNYDRHNYWMPPDWLDQIGGHDAIFFGAVGWPARVPDHVSLRGSLLKFRRDLRPVREPAPRAPDARHPVAARGPQPGDIDFYVVRENTEGEYSSMGGRVRGHRPRDRHPGIRLDARRRRPRLKYAFELAQTRPRKHLTSATKSNGIAITMPYWDERVAAMAKRFPDVKRPTSTTSTS
jgi:tartrate dehydrogenase/decarboxylase/D-malate dehydrogenase